MKRYKIEFQDEEFENISAENNSEAWTTAFTYEDEHGTVMEINEIDEDYNIIGSCN